MSLEVDRLSPDAYARLAKLLKPKMNKYFLEPPLPKQTAFLLLDNMEAMYGGAAGGGKEIHINTYVPTAFGWTTMGEIKVGEQIFGENGQVVTVTNVFDIDEKPESYKIVFEEGYEILACADHNWLTYTTKEMNQILRKSDDFRARRRANRPSRGTGKRPDLAEKNRIRALEHQSVQPTGTVRTTKEIFHTTYDNRGHNNHAIPVHSGLDLPEIKLPIDPYCLGAWLGDGYTHSASICGIDQEIFDEFDKAGYQTTDRKDPIARGIRDFTPSLRKAGFDFTTGSKHIPTIYMRASKAQRLAVIQGLMDTDGHCSIEDGSVEFVNTNIKIAEGMLELVRSMGWKANMQEGRATLYGKDCGPKYRISWSPDQYVFRLQRKIDRQKIDRHRSTKFMHIKQVVPIDPVPMRCIKVDNPTGLFLVGKEMIVTHNSSALLMGALQYVDVPGYAALILRRTFADLSLPGAIMTRAKEWLCHHPEVHWSEKDKTFTFPSGATITFGYLENSKDKYRYQGSEFQYVAFDELTQFPKEDYEYLYSRMRKKTTIPVPIRMRAATNPGGPHGGWVKKHFVDTPNNAEKVFIRATVLDNPNLNYEEYKKSLDHLGDVERARMLYGDWDARPEGIVYPEMEDATFDLEEKIRNEGFPEGEHYGGIDWGFASPFACLCGVLDANQHLWIYFERYMRNKTVKEHADALPREHDLVIFADPAQPESIAQMRKMDFTVRKANNDIKSGIAIVKEWLRTGRLHISTECKSLLEEAKLYRRRSEEKKKDGEVGDVQDGDPDIPIKKNDHACDACRYICVGVYKLIGGFRDDESGDDINLPESTVEMKKHWKASESPYVGDEPTKQETEEFRDSRNEHWWT